MTEVGKARIECPTCGTSKTVPLDEWEAVVQEHNTQRHNGADIAVLEKAILPKRKIRADGGEDGDSE